MIEEIISAEWIGEIPKAGKYVGKVAGCLLMLRIDRTDGWGVDWKTLRVKNWANTKMDLEEQIFNVNEEGIVAIDNPSRFV